MKLQAFLPLITYPEANSDSVAANATAMAAWLDADLNATSFDIDMQPGWDTWLRMLYVGLPELLREAEEMSRERGKHLLELVGQQATDRGVNLTTSTAAQPLLGEVIAEHARYFDMSLLEWEAGNLASRSTAQAITFGSGRPVVLLPATTEIASVGHVAIAWDGSRVAARAVADALPFLQRASRTSVLTVIDEKPLKDKGTAERFADSLSKRGVVAEALSIRAAGSSIGMSLQEHAIERRADLLVMGGFGHSVVRDFVLGGATENVLDDLRLPTLLSH
jgi:nucleotide-binding universal stress UspA family protein